MNSLDKQCPWTIRLSSAGLIYFHFGRRVICELIRRLPPPSGNPTAGDISQLEALHRTPDPEHPVIRTLWLRLYRSLIQELDAIDNGVNIASETKFAPQSQLNYVTLMRSERTVNLIPKYCTYSNRYEISTHLSARVGRLNPRWNQPADENLINAVL